MTQAGLAFLMA